MDAFAEYLQEKLGEPVKLVTWTIEDTYTVAEQNRVDFIVTNPAQSAGLVAAYGAVPVVSLERPSGKAFAGVIISNKNKGIKSAADVKGKTVMAYNEGSAGAYLFQRYHLQQKDVDITSDVAKLLFAKKQDDIVLAVRAGMVDVGFVRTGILESMVKDNRLNLKDIEIVDAVKDDSYPLIRSTELYPSWYVLAAKGTPAKVSEALKTEALALPSDHPAAKSAKVVGFIEPLPIDNMMKLMRELRISPFDRVDIGMSTTH